MTQAKETERRDRQFNVGLTAREYALLHKRAAALGMRPVDYGRARLFSVRTVGDMPERYTPHLDPLFIARLSRLGNNLNQIARKLHALDVPAPDSLEPLLLEIRDLIRRGFDS
jgi:hypothetical protein